MKMKKVLVCIFAVAVLLLAGCVKQEAPAAQTEPERDIDINLMDQYGMLSVQTKETDGTIVTEEFNGVGALGFAGEPMGNCFAEYHSITPVLEGDSFEGWMECRYDDELGNYVIVSETIYSTEELMALPVPETSATYVVKWAGIPVEEYFVMDASDAVEDASTSGIFALCGNGGSLQFLSSYGDEYSSVGYGYGLEESQALNDVMGTEYGDSLIGLSKDGAAFTGWTVYMAEDLFWSYESVEDEDMLCLVYDENGYEGVQYVLLRNAVVVDENMSTEQLCGMAREGENYLAMANWETGPENAQPAVFAFSGNGGSIHLFSHNDEEYKTVAYSYALENGQALNDVMGTEYGDALIGVTKDGAEFLGWTLYMADEISWGYEEVYDTEILCLLYNDSGSRGPEYALLKNGSLVGEYMPTEQLCGMTSYGENYLAMAIWSQ